MLTYRSPMLAHRRWGLLACVGVLAFGSGCGLVLDNDPPDVKGGPTVDGGREDSATPLDGGSTEDAAPSDGSTRDGARIDGDVVCPASCDDDDPCTEDHCDTTIGKCVHDPLPDSSSCDDGDLCTFAECKSGECMPIEEVACPTGAACVPSTGECECRTDDGYIECGTGCVLETEAECQAGDLDEVGCGGCGQRVCNDVCQWGECEPEVTAETSCGELEATRCNLSTNTCEICYNDPETDPCEWSTTPIEMLSCETDDACANLSL